MGQVRHNFPPPINRLMADEHIDSEFRRHFRIIGTQYLDGLVDRLGGQLDSVLLFSSLFSAINTALLIAALPDGSGTDYSASAPSLGAFVSEIGGNVAFAIALALTLALSFGALLAKQWIAEFKPNLYGAPDGCRELQRKVILSDLYHIRWNTEAVPFMMSLVALVLLLVGLALFVMFFWGMNLITSCIVVITVSLTVMALAITTVFGVAILHSNKHVLLPPIHDQDAPGIEGHLHQQNEFVEVDSQSKTFAVPQSSTSDGVLLQLPRVWLHIAPLA